MTDSFSHLRVVVSLTFTITVIIMRSYTIPMITLKEIISSVNGKLTFRVMHLNIQFFDHLLALTWVCTKKFYFAKWSIAWIIDAWNLSARKLLLKAY